MFIQVCQLAPDSVKSQLSCEQKGVSCSEPNLVTIQERHRIMKQPAIENFMDRKPAVEEIDKAQENLTLALITGRWKGVAISQIQFLVAYHNAAFCNSGNVPWNFLNNEFFKKFCSTIRPTLPHLSADNASSTVLAALDSRVTANIHEFIRKAKSITLVTDSWTSVSSQK